MTGGHANGRPGSYPVAMDPLGSDSQASNAAPQRRTSGWPPTRNEWIGLIVALVLGTVAVVVLGWYGVLR